jgi:Ring finger domain
MCFRFISTIGDLQTIIIQSFNLPKENLLYIMHNTNILGIDYLFEDLIIEHNLFDTHLHVVTDPYHTDTGTKTLYNTWLQDRLQGHSIADHQLQILYYQTNKSFKANNTEFFARTDTATATTRNNNRRARTNIENIAIGRNTNPTTAVANTAIGHNSSNMMSSLNNLNNVLNNYLNDNIASNSASSSTSSSSSPSISVGRRRRAPLSTNIGFEIEMSGPGGGNMEILQSLLSNNGILQQFMNNTGSGEDFLNLLNAHAFENVPITLTPETLNNLPIFKFNELPENIKDSNTCSICQEEYKDDEEIRLLLCKHYFHKRCIDQWLSAENVRCPLCRHDNREEAPRVTTPTI